VITVLIDSSAATTSVAGRKAASVVFLVILPWLGVLIDLIVEHDGMRQRSVEQAQAQRQELDDNVRARRAAGPPPRSRRPRSCSTPAPSRRRSSRR